MRTTTALAFGLVGLVATGLAVQLHAQSQKPTVEIPQPGVPQIMTLEGKFVRVAYNNEGYVILGYQIANRTIGSDWIMLDVGITLMDKVKDYTLKRDALSLDTPDGTLPLPSIEEYRQNQTHGVNRLGMFSDLGSRALPWDQADVSADRACMGQLYFHIPNGTKYGQYWLNVKFAQSVVRVPFRLLTEDEEKQLGKNFGDIKKQVDNSFRKKKS
jgi:hypothetical protein